jgi:hypothetical protein
MAAPHEKPKVIHAVFDGENLVPEGRIDLKAGEHVTLHVVESHDQSAPVESNPRERWIAFQELRGILEAPIGFNWNYERDELYRREGL